MTDFLYTIETPANFNDGDVYTSDLDKATDYCYDLSEEFGYSCVRCNITGNIVLDYGDIMPLVAEGIV